jgi:glucokinase
VTAPLVLAADVGGTRTRAALVDQRGTVLLRRSVGTPGHADVPEALIDLVCTVGAEHHLGTVSHAVVGLPGAVDYEAGRLLWAPHLPERWPDLLSRDALSAGIGLPTHIANDADLAAVGEAAFGAGVGTTDVAYLTISTGIGAGVIHDGRLLRGRRSLAEVGHTVIDWTAWQEGSPCTFEELGSGSGLARLARESGLGALDARGIEAAMKSGEAGALAIWRGAIAACAVGICNLVMTFSPSTVVVGGGLGCDPGFFEPLRDFVLSRPERHPADLTIVQSALGDDAGLAGAAAWEAATSA